MIEIDGSHGEGGGQILRTAVSLSAITGNPVKINNIRANRPKPGLQASHLEAVKSVAKICNTGIVAKLGDTSLTFVPKEIEGGHLRIDIGTAGAISLVLQSVALPALHAEHPVTMKITGGTHVKWSPSMDYMQKVFSYYMKKICIDFEMDIERYGFYPKGGGAVNVKIVPHVPKALQLVGRGRLLNGDIISIGTDDLRSAHVAERQITGVEKYARLENKSVRYVSAHCTGSAVMANYNFDNCIIGASSLGDRGIKAQAVGESAGRDLKKQLDSGACVDEYMADQLLPFLAFASGPSRISVAEITEHVRTNIWVIEQFLPVKFSIDEKKKIIEVKRK